MLLGRNSKTNFRICTSIENLDFTFSEKSQEENACKTFCLCKHSIELKSWVFCSEILQTSWEFRFLAMHLCFTMDSNPVWIRNKISVLQFYPFWSGIKIFILLPIYETFTLFMLILTTNSEFPIKRILIFPFKEFLFIFSCVVQKNIENISWSFRIKGQ